MTRLLGLSAMLLVALASLGCEKAESGQGGAASRTSVDASGRCEHEIKVETCPFCKPDLVESEGFCGAHGFPEALCAQCRPYLKVAFRTQGDWCEEHKLPESQCMACNPELAENIRPGEHGVAMPAASGEASTCEHAIDESQCPFCTPSLIETAGFCQGHGVAEALCVQCRPFLKTAFVAKGDWCGEHDTPESQCVLCNPELKADGG